MRLGDEDGIALFTAVIVSALLLVMATTVVTFSSASQRSAAYSGASADAYALAEGGIGQAMAVLSKPENNALKADLLPAATVTQFTTGTATWGGVLAGDTWTLTSTGRVSNPTGPHATAATRTVRARVRVHPTVTQPLNNPAWNYVYATRPPSSGCDEVVQQSVQISSPFFVSGNLCLQNTASIMAGPLVVKGWLDLQQKQNTVGTSSKKISDAHIANGCRYQSNGAFHKPCPGASDNVFATVLDSTPIDIQPPVVYWDAWYQNASPGPHFPCTTRTGTPPTFDLPTPDGRNGTYNLSPFNLTPALSYSCETAAGSISWDAIKKVLTVSGTIFIDGSAYIQNGAVNEYNGQATLYLSGTFLMKNSKLCAGLSANKSTCDVATWNPNTGSSASSRAAPAAR